jgi:hypothetical protein
MGTEIAVGHSYVRGGDMPDVPQLTGNEFADKELKELGKAKTLK